MLSWRRLRLRDVEGVEHASAAISLEPLTHITLLLLEEAAAAAEHLAHIAKERWSYQTQARTSHPASQRIFYPKNLFGLPC